MLIENEDGEEVINQVNERKKNILLLEEEDLIEGGGDSDS
jgi:uncharacterized protein YlzI (FlbEa/FlbD family)